MGAGNMAGAVLRGGTASGVLNPKEVLLAPSPDPSAERLAAATGARVADSAPALVSASDVVVLAVKPHVVPIVLAEVHDVAASHTPLVVSVAAGLSTTRLESLLPAGARVVRTMPNMAALVGEAMTALAPGRSATPEDLATARRLMGSVGAVTELDEHLFSTFTAISGSSPAFVLTFVEALARAGVLGGIPKGQAVEIVTQVLLGTARTVQAEAQQAQAGQAARTPADLVDAVSSPGGTTVAGLVAMERAGFSDAVIRGAQAAAQRDRELGEG
ncbi:pyrroline-5-carboxylate reductase [Actinomyces lilanjuaniae]|nr:pyrroline-5-carboxylate reductase [Actinomyces lilanjuaniae]